MPEQKFLTDLKVTGTVDLNNLKINTDQGTDGQVLTSTGTGVGWEDAVGVSETAERIEVTVKNISGGSLSKGTVVHTSPSANPPNGNLIEVIAADYDDITKMPAIGILNETIANEAEGSAVMMGALSGINTSSFSIGDELYVGNLGTLTNSKPTTAGQLIQKIAVVIKSHASNGLIKIFGAGRSNDVPLPLYIDNTNQRVGIGDSTPSYTLDVNGTIYGSAVRSGRYYGASGTSSYLDLDSAAPYSLLASSEVSISNSITCNDLTATETSGIAATSGPVYANRFHGNGNTTYFVDPNNSTTSAILNGKVGIGTTGPSNGKLQIDSTGNQISIETGTSGDGRLHIGHFANGTFIGTYGDDGGAADIIRFGTHSGDEKMRIDSSGNVGIGVSPGYKLDVNGQGNFSDYLNVASSTGIKSTGWVHLHRYGSSTNVAVGNNGTDVNLYVPNGKVGIGTTSPTTPLEIVNSDNTLLYLNSSTANVYLRLEDANSTNGNFIGATTDDMHFWTNNTERMRIGSAGQIGIGGANYGTSGQVLTSNGSSSAPSWQTPTTGDITGVTAGSYMTGGGTSGTVTLNANASTSDTANTLVARETSGDINVRLLRASYANQSTISGAMAFRVNNGADNYTRYCNNPAAIRTFIGAAAAGDENIIDGALSIWNADGDGDVLKYSDSNPVHNGDGVGAVINITGDGTELNSLVRAGIYTGDHISVSRGYYVGGILNTSNANTQQVITADGDFKVGARGYELRSGSITVNGDANTYYPVTWYGGYQAHYHKIQIHRNYNEAAPSTWNNSTHKGGLILDLQANWGGWGGIHYDIKINEFSEIYSTMVGKIAHFANNRGFAIWLRGGGAVYHFSTQGIGADPAVQLSAYDPGNNSTGVSGITTIDTAFHSRHYYRSGILYSQNSQVLTVANEGSGNGLDADTVDGIQGTSFLRSDAADTFTGKLAVGSTNIRRAGIYGIYDASRTGHIWSMGTAYNIPDNGANFGNLYGLAYKHTNNSTGGTMGGGHQVVWCDNGNARGSIGYNSVWHAESMKAPIFIDSANTNYYANPYGTSVFKNLTLRNDNTQGYYDSKIEFRNNSNSFKSHIEFLSNSGVTGYRFYITASGASTTNVQYELEDRELTFQSGTMHLKNNIINANTHSLTGSSLVSTPALKVYQRATNISYTYYDLVTFHATSNAAQKGSIRVNAYGTQYATSSDYRLKENEIPIADGIQRVKQLQPKRFNFIGYSEQSVDGFMAHEVQDVIHEAVSGVKDEVDEEGNPVYQSIDQSKLVPLLTAALKEAIAKIEDLETRIQTLENQ
jgi:hypothetical protein